MLAQRYNVKLGREIITGILYVLSFGLIILFNPAIMPAWPILPSDLALSIRAIADWARELTVLLLPYTGGAMSLYNVLLKDVFEQLSPVIVSTETVG
jgi:putative effector of murein hydrolase LrgA (UPF0299 family)